ncbi:MAG: hypothetical protein V3R25_09275 [Nitrosomonadaceae bacterium]
MKVLQNGTKTTTDIYRYTVSQCGTLRPSSTKLNNEKVSVDIIFINGVFELVEEDVARHYIERSVWHIIEAIGRRITEIEDSYRVPTIVDCTVK